MNNSVFDEWNHSVFGLRNNKFRKNKWDRIPEWFPVMALPLLSQTISGGTDLMIPIVWAQK